MKNWIKQALLLVSIIVLSFSTKAIDFPNPNDLEPTYEWTEYSTVDGILIEYKFEECNYENVNNQILVLFRYTNTTNKSLELSWRRKIFRNGECMNCHRLENAEHGYSLKLEPNQVIVGQGNDKTDERLFVFSNFIQLTPGMSDQRLTDIEMVNVEVKKQ